mgnify:CR=1 FL=1
MDLPKLFTKGGYSYRPNSIWKVKLNLKLLTPLLRVSMALQSPFECQDLASQIWLGELDHLIFL